MRKTFSILILFTSLNATSQEKVTIINSGELIREGIGYHEDGKYDKALLKYKQINENDTNYALAIYEMGITYLAQEDFTKAIELYEKAVKMESNLKTSFIQQLGNSYSGNKQTDKAIEVYQAGLKEFPYFFRFYSEMGVAAAKNNQPKLALLYFDSCLQINFLYGRAHFLMGQICQNNNYLIPAMLSYQMAAYLSYDNAIGLNSILNIQKIANGENKVNKDSIVQLFAENENNFGDIEEIIVSKSELDEKYKVKPAIDLPFNAFVKSLHLVNTRLALITDGKGWYFDNLVPIFTEWAKKKELPIVMYRMAYATNNDQAKKMYQKTKSKSDKHFGDFVNLQVNSKLLYKSRFPELSGNFKHIFTFKNGNLFQMVPEDQAYDFNKPSDLTADGHFIYFYNSGNKKSEGNIKNGNQTGEWKYYSENGLVEKRVKNISEKEFTRTIYYSNNQPKTYEHLKDGKNIEKYVTYYNNGIPNSVITINTAGEIDGKVYFYYDNGQLNHFEVYEKGKVKNSEIISYHRNGVLKSKIKFKNEEKDGDVTEYYNDGKVRIVTKYKNGKVNGVQKEYYRNGVLMNEGTFLNGEYNGIYKTYFDNGVLETEANYANGENKGKSLYYDFDGKLYAEYLENKGKIKTATYYSKNGEKIYDVDAQKDELNIQKYNEVGIKIEEGKVKKSFRTGTWKFYSNSGALKTIKEYDEKGDFNGKVEKFITGNILDEKYEMQNNKMHGYYIEYYANGNKYREGNYFEGNREGLWRYYFLNKNTKEEYYYAEDKAVGTRKFYYPNGKLKNIEEYKEGLFYKFKLFDINGELASEDTVGYPYGNLAINFTNGNKCFDFTYKNGKKEGKQIIYWANGNIKSEEEYMDGEQINIEKNYFESGKLKSTYFYKDGLYDSTYYLYFENGQVEEIINYKENDFSGKHQYFHSSGKVLFSGNYKYDYREGWVEYLSSDGNLQYKILYHMGIELAYSYLNKNGKAVDSLPFKNASGDFTCYFQNGNISAKGTFVNGERHGVYTRYYSNGKKEFEANYNYGLDEGLMTDYYDNGKIKVQVNNAVNRKDGVEKEYDSKGVLEKETTWENDLKHGPQNFYTNGKLLKTIIYTYGNTTDK